MKKQEKYYNMIDWWVKVTFTKYATFSGRARRAEYWYFSLVQTLLFITLFLITVIFAALQWPLLATSITILMALCTIGILIPSLAVTIRRLHDINKSGWYFLLYFVPFGNLVLFIFTLLEGDRKPNQYGLDPKAPKDEINLIGTE